MAFRLTAACPLPLDPATRFLARLCATGKSVAYGNRTPSGAVFR